MSNSSNILLQSRIEMLNNSIQPIVDKLSKRLPFLSAALFFEDKQHVGSASTASVVNTALINPERLKFTEAFIRGRRVDLTSTVLGKTFSTHQSQLEISKMNPKHHLTWGLYFEPQPDQAAVLQLIFDRNLGYLIDESIIMPIVQNHFKDILIACKLIIERSSKNDPLGDELLLDVPTVPNAYIIKWDVIESTKKVIKNYPMFRHYLKELQTEVDGLASHYDAKIVAFHGDGQNIILDVPGYIDRCNLSQVGAFGQDVVLPFIKNLEILSRNISLNYHTINPKLRIGVGLGHVEQLKTGEITGPIFWEITNLFKENKNKPLLINSLAQNVLVFGPQN